MYSALAAQGFAGSDPRHARGTDRQAMLRRRPTCHNQKDPRLKIYNYVSGALWGEKGKIKKKILKKRVKIQLTNFWNESGDLKIFTIHFKWILRKYYLKT